MKRFLFSVFAVAVFFLGVGALVEETGARLKSDEKALDLINKARHAIGGEAAIANVQSMIVVGRTTQKFKVNGVETSHEGETEIAMQMPDKLSRTVKIGKDDGSSKAHVLIDRIVDVEVVGNGKDQKAYGHGVGKGVGTEHRIVIKKDDGTVQELTGEEAAKWVAAHPERKGEFTVRLKKADGTDGEYDAKVKGLPRKTEGGATFTSPDGKTFNIEGHHDVMMARHDGMRSNEMLRTTLGLLLTAPKGVDVEYTFAGEGNVDGTACNIVAAAFGGETFRLYLDRSSNLPVAIGYKASSFPRMAKFNHDVPAGSDRAMGDVMFFKREAGPETQVDAMIKFSDYRAVGGVQLPHRWTQTGGGDETFEVTAYQINPADIGEKFKDQRVMLTRKKADGQ